MFVIMARCLFEALTEFMLWLFKLSRGTLLLLSRTTGKRKFILFKIWREMGGQTEVFNSNVEILLHHRPNFFHDEWRKEADEGVSAWWKFLHRPRCFGVNESKGNSKLDETKRVLTLVGCFPSMDCRMVLLTPAVLLVISPSSCL